MPSRHAPGCAGGRSGDHHVVKMLNDAGAFQLRKSVEQVAEVLGVSRSTVDNHLNRPGS